MCLLKVLFKFFLENKFYSSWIQYHVEKFGTPQKNISGKPLYQENHLHVIFYKKEKEREKN